MTNHVTSSAASLTSKFGSSIPLFSPVPNTDPSFFNEGPHQPDTNVFTSLSGAMDTSAIDAYTQGVEITSDKRYVAGIAKIWSGEPGHILKNNRFGMDKVTFPGTAFADIDLFSPSRFLEAQDAESPLWSSILTYPIIVGDDDRIENLNFDGVVEPLTIRAAASFFSTEMPHAAHSVKGAVMAGNLDQYGGTEQVLTVDVYDVDAIVPYVDAQHYQLEASADTLPFVDERFVRSEPFQVGDDGELVVAMTSLGGSSDNYVKFNQRSSTCGFIFDGSTVIGTDSLAFGGQTHGSTSRARVATPTPPPLDPRVRLLSLLNLDLAHLWDNYDSAAGIWYDTVGVLSASAQTTPPVGMVLNGHHYPMFDGLSTGLQADDASTLDDLDSWTIFFVFKTNNGQAFGAIVDHSQQFYIELMLGAGTIFAGVQGGGTDIIGTIPVNDNAFHRGIVTVNSTAASLYVDGVLDTTATFPAQSHTANPYLLGVQPNATVTDSSVTIVGIATRGLTTSEVGQLDAILASYQ